MLTQVADGVWVRQSEWVWTNSLVVRGDDGFILVDPGIHGSEIKELADDLDRLGVPVVAGFSTHPHCDHLIWHSRFGDVPRYATAAGWIFAADTRELQLEGPEEDGGADVPLELIALVTPLPVDGGPVPGELIEHQAHAVGHAAILLADRGVLLAGDMLSDILIPLFDSRQDDQFGAYETAFDLLDEAVGQVDVLVPGHGTVAEGPEVAARLAADRAYVDALRRGEDPVDAGWRPRMALRSPRVEPGAGPRAVGSQEAHLRAGHAPACIADLEARGWADHSRRETTCARPFDPGSSRSCADSGPACWPCSSSLPVAPPTRQTRSGLGHHQRAGQVPRHRHRTGPVGGRSRRRSPAPTSRTRPGSIPASRPPGSVRCASAENLGRPFLQARTHCANLDMRVPTIGEALQLAVTHDIPLVGETEEFWTDESFDDFANYSADDRGITSRAVWDVSLRPSAL